MVRTLVIGDPHFREGFVADMELFIDGILEVVDSNTLDMIVVLGDVMDRHGILHQKPFHQACRFLIELAKRYPTYCLIGNHDFDIPSKYLPENNPFKVMVWSKIPNLTIVDKPMRSGNMAFIPYVPPGMFTRALSEIDMEGVGLVFAHQEFLGCRLGRLVSEVGDPWPMEDFGKHPFIVSGHIHDYQTLGENIMYTGTPIQINYGESEKKGVCMLDVNQDPITGLPVSKTEKWFKITVPKKITKTIPFDNLETWIQERLGTLSRKYGIEAKYEKGKPKKNHCLEELERAVKSDKLIDKLKLQIQVEKTTAGIRAAVNQLKTLPLGIEQVFIIESTKNVQTTTPSQVSHNHRDWLEAVHDKISGHAKSQKLKHLLQECLE